MKYTPSDERKERIRKEMLALKKKWREEYLSETLVHMGCGRTNCIP